MQDIYTIDKKRVRRSFDLAAPEYDKHAVLQAEVRNRMLERLDYLKLSPQTILDAGCGTGGAIHQLQSRYQDSRVIAMDIAHGMARFAVPKANMLQRMLNKRTVFGLCGDCESLPLQSQSLDMIWSNLAIQWCNDLDAVFNEAARTLRPEGLIMFSTLGPDTLKELRQATSEAQGHTHVSRFIDMHDIGDALVRAGFTAPVMDVERIVLTYADVKALMRDLKAIGAHNATEGRARGLQGRRFLQSIETQYEKFRTQGKLPATYEVVYGHAWRGAPKPDDGLAVIKLHRKSA